MPRTLVPIDVPLGPYPTFPIAADSADLVMTAFDTVNKNAIPFGTAARLLVIVQNATGGAGTVTFTSAPDALNRIGDVSAYAMASNELAAFIFERNGWRQSDGALYCEASDATVKVAAIQL